MLLYFYRQCLHEVDACIVSHCDVMGRLCDSSPHIHTSSKNDNENYDDVMMVILVKSLIKLITFTTAGIKKI